MRGPYTAFAEVAGAYERGRPGYPEDAVRWLVGSEPHDVVDLGAGTGKLTRSLVALGHRVTAVEPLEEMRAQLTVSVPGVTVIAGSAEAMPLPDASADVVVRDVFAGDVAIYRFLIEGVTELDHDVIHAIFEFGSAYQ